MRKVGGSHQSETAPKNAPGRRQDPGDPALTLTLCQDILLPLRQINPSEIDRASRTIANEINMPRGP